MVAATEKSFAKKMSYCVRSYKHVNNLYDVFYISSSIDRSNDALMEHFTLSGVTKLSAHRFLDRFMESASWE